eukprot:3529814-Heterocapsa_arctica.AAC.1
MVAQLFLSTLEADHYVVRGLVSLWAAHAKRESARGRSTRPSTLRTKVQGPRCKPGGSEPRYD